MGIRLNWEIEAEQERIAGSGEDPEAARRRRRARNRFLLLVGGFLLVIGAAVGAFVLRLRYVDGEIDNRLRETIAAEIAALRLGDREAYLDLQRSATNDWRDYQSGVFDEWQALKTQADVTLTGRVLETEVDGLRARAMVEEIINGVPYARLGFYWRYGDDDDFDSDPDGWRHVPPDYTFWGEAASLEAPGLLIDYRAADEALAAALGDAVGGWLIDGCAALACAGIPPLTIAIVPDDYAVLEWQGDAITSGRLIIPSPLIRRMRLDQPFDPSLRLVVAQKTADWLMASINPQAPRYPADAYYLRFAIASWLVGRFTQTNTNSFLISSIAGVYGDGSVGRVLQALQPDSSIRAIAGAVGAPSLAAAPLDWRDFLTWRLQLERELSGRGDQTSFFALYDTREDAGRALAYERYALAIAAPDDAPPQGVTAVAPFQQSGSDPALLADVVTGQGESAVRETVTFRFVEGTWRRAS